MADRVLFVSWGNPIPGAEARAAESLKGASDFYTRRQQEGRIESFDVVGLEPNNTVTGFALVRGSAEQIAALREDEEFTSLILQGRTKCPEVSIVQGHINEGLTRMLDLFKAAAVGP